MKFILSSTLLPLLIANAFGSHHRHFDGPFSDILSNYSKHISPQLSGDEPVGVWVGLAPFYLDVDEMGVLTGRAWLILAWKDHRLEFNPDEFGGIKKFTVPADRIWVPDIGVYNRRHAWTSLYKTSEATVSPDGVVHLFPNVEIDALCGDEEPSEYGIWEEKDCTIEVGSEINDGTIIDISSYGNMTEMHMDEFKAKISPVKILSSAVSRSVKFFKCCPEPYPRLSFEMTVQKKFRVTHKGKVSKNPLLYTTMEMSKRNRITMSRRVSHGIVSAEDRKEEPRSGDGDYRQPRKEESRNGQKNTSDVPH